MTTANLYVDARNIAETYTPETAKALRARRVSPLMALGLYNLARTIARNVARTGGKVASGNVGNCPDKGGRDCSELAATSLISRGLAEPANGRAYETYHLTLTADGAQLAAGVTEGIEIAEAARAARIDAFDAVNATYIVEGFVRVRVVAAVVAQSHEEAARRFAAGRGKYTAAVLGDDTVRERFDITNAMNPETVTITGTPTIVADVAASKASHWASESAVLAFLGIDEDE